MNLLLLLSALLSALTGVGASARALPASAVAERVVVQQSARPARAVSVRPVQALVPIGALARVRVVLSSAPPVATPLYLLRRRE